MAVLGRQTVEALAKQDLEPADYWQRVGVHFLLDENIQRAGEKIPLDLVARAYPAQAKAAA